MFLVLEVENRLDHRHHWIINQIAEEIGTVKLELVCSTVNTLSLSSIHSSDVVS